MYLSQIKRCHRPVLLPLALSLIGCANRGNPRPPSLHLPAPATDLKVERVADQVIVSWTTSDKTSDGLLKHGSATAVVCRDVVTTTPSHPAPCTPILRLSSTPGQSRAVDTLPPVLLTDSARLLAYRVELMNAKNRSAGPSMPALTASGAAPPAPGQVRITATRRGAMVEWTPVETTAEMELTRTLVEDDRGSIPAAAPKKKTSAGIPDSKPKDPAAPVLLRASQVNQKDLGGLLDPGVAPHNTYAYTAQRVRTVQLDGRSYQLHSASSGAVTFIYKDVFPPTAPVGLESIASAPVRGGASIDLSWEPSVEDDILGYNVFRAESTGTFVRLNKAPLASPSYRDMTARAGRAYRYRVTAVDRSSNESAPGAEIQDSLPKQP